MESCGSASDMSVDIEHAGVSGSVQIRVLLYSLLLTMVVGTSYWAESEKVSAGTGHQVRGMLRAR